MHSRTRVVAVVVAFNRRDLLRRTLEGIAAQTRPVDAVVVIDNASSDGSAELAEGYARVTRLPVNLGGAGGFVAGIERALTTERAGAVWLMDDDSVPSPTALQELLVVGERAPDGTALVASRVLWRDGRDHPMNTPRTRPGTSARSRRSAVAHDAYPIRTASFVSILVDADAIRTTGLPVADYFLWNDDLEFTARLLRRYRGYVARRSVVEHLTRTFGDSEVDPGPRFRLEVRNKVWFFARSRALGPAEGLLYAASTVRRWIATIRRSDDRGVLVRGLVTGLGEGIRGRPRDNAVVLADSSDIARGIRALESAARGTSR